MADGRRISPTGPALGEYDRSQGARLDMAWIRCSPLEHCTARRSPATPIEPHHEYPELETRSPAPAKPPAYDIAFVWSENPRVAWPIEAKVLSSPNKLADYLGDVEKFTIGVAAPLTGEGAQIAYLLTGTADTFFANLSQRLSSPLLSISAFADRPHRCSTRTRKAAPELHLHHMVMVCCPETVVISSA